MDVNTQESGPKYTYTVGSGGLTSVAIYGIVHYFKRRSWARALVGGIGALFLILFIAGVLSLFSGMTIVPLQGNYVVAFLGLLMVSLGVVAGPEFEVVFPAQAAAREREDAERTFEETAKPEDAIEVDLKRLNEYYAINQLQARSSFRWAVFAMLIGFGTIIAGIWLFYLRAASRDVFMAGLSTSAGIVANLLSAFFLHLHNKTQDRALHYYNQLAQVQRLSIAIRLAEAHSDEAARGLARDRVINAMLPSPESPSVQTSGG